MSAGLPHESVEAMLRIFDEHPEVRRVVLYGSRAKGCARPNSDIDLTVDAPGMSLRELLEIEDRLDDLLLPWKIDLSLLHHIENPALLEHIARVGVDLREALSG